MQDNTGNTSRELLIGSLLLLVLVITRSGITRSHFGTDINLPDASWAMFWLLGVLTHQRGWPMASMACCVAVDYFVIAGGVAADCFTPAYVFLIPAYGALWLSGRWLRRQTTDKYLLRTATSLVAGVSACFAISNLGFYLASGYSGEMSMSAYAAAVARYWPHYLLHASVYAGAGLLIAYIAQHRAALFHRTGRTD